MDVVHANRCSRLEDGTLPAEIAGPCADLPSCGGILMRDAPIFGQIAPSQGHPPWRPFVVLTDDRDWAEPRISQPAWPQG